MSSIEVGVLSALQGLADRGRDEDCSSPPAQTRTVGDIFLLQDERRLMRRVRMGHADGKWHAVVSHRQPERRVELRNGLRAGFFDQRERYAKVLGP